MHNSSLTYTWQFQNSDNWVVFIKDGQEKPTQDVDFNKEVSIILNEPAKVEVNGIVIEVIQFKASSINSILQGYAKLLLDKKSTTVEILNFFTQP